MSSFTLTAASAESFGTSYVEAVEPRPSCIEAFLLREAEALAADELIAVEVHHARSTLGMPDLIAEANDADGEDWITMWSVPRSLDALWEVMFPGDNANQIARFVTEHANEDDLQLFAMTKMLPVQLAVATHPRLDRMSSMAVIAQTKNTDVWEAVARNEALNPSTIARFWELAVVVDMATEVSLYVASNMKTPMRIVDEILAAHDAADPEFGRAARSYVTELRRTNQLLASLGRPTV